MDSKECVPENDNEWVILHLSEKSVYHMLTDEEQDLAAGEKMR